MPDPISCSSVQRGRYDVDTGVCEPEAPVCSSSEAAQGSGIVGGFCGEPPGPASRAAVQRLVAGARRARRTPATPARSCGREVATAVATCGAAAAAALVGTGTGPGDLAIVGFAGAKCGTAVVDGYDCVGQ